MTKEQQKQLTEILKNNRGNIYDFIADNYWEMTKEDLKDLALECVATMYQFADRLQYQLKGTICGAGKKAHDELLENISNYREHLIEE